MSAPEERPEVALVLLASGDAAALKEYINRQIVVVGNAMVQDTLEMRGALYPRRNYTVGALVALDPEVRRLVSRAGVRLASFDEAIAMAMNAIQAEMNQSNPAGQKLIKVFKDANVNGLYR